MDATANESARSARFTRRSFLKGAAASAAGVAAIAALGPGSVARAIAPPLTVTRVEASDGQALFVERVAGRHSSDPNTWRPTGHLFVRNNGGGAVTLSSITIFYGGGSAPAPVMVGASQSIAAGKTAVIAIPEHRLLPYPLPATVTFRLTCVGFADPAWASFPLAHMNHHTPDGALPFPMRSSETKNLGNGQQVYLATGNNHGFNSNHGNTREQRFAYDFVARRWTGSQWSSIAPGTDGTLPEHYLIWGQPVYAVANAKIVAGWRNRPDDAIDVDTSPGGNGFWMQLTGGDGQTATFALYAHLMHGSIPPELVPVEGGPGPYVTKGQFLGLVGKSGTKKPHLHFHIQRGIADYVANPAATGEGLPIRFGVMDVLGREHYNPQVPGVGWKYAVLSGIGEDCLVQAEAPAWVGPIQTTGMALPNPSLTAVQDPGNLMEIPQGQQPTRR
jgi:hypothetical protein